MYDNLLTGGIYMQIKTYPLQFTEQELREIEKVAGKRNIKSFIYKAIAEKMEKEISNGTNETK